LFGRTRNLSDGRNSRNDNDLQQFSQREIVAKTPSLELAMLIFAAKNQENREK
jgi:hypothetical protein